ncbi:Pycsar system effector family protein [Chthonobacter rhizosphaerae]|uniref:Pycsar system effector family protein n=1 Tax=Chthonobacter rhizosphaerae TaxID=2735553 RepID=UPI0015EE6A98|nr:Pycsar system effector family protein [Chthonobacter rhizosphaerae]
MDENDRQEAFERLLTAILGRVVDFLKFAEAKNAALLTFASAWIIASINLLNGSTPLTPAWQKAYTVALPIFAIAALLAIISLLPRTLLTRIYRDPNQAKSLLYFGDIATFEPAAYKERVRERYYPPENEAVTRNFLDDLSIQIAANSQITLWKMKLFNAGALLVLLALVVLFIPAAGKLWAFASSYMGPPDVAKGPS